MVRFWAVVVLALVPVTAVSARTQGDKDDKDVKIEGQLKEGDPKDKEFNTPTNAHKVPLKAGNIYVIKMLSKDVDSFLKLNDPAGKELAFDDDGDGYPDSKIVFECKKDGDYNLICTCFPEPMNGLKLYGKYTLTVKKGTKDDLKGDKKDIKKGGPNPHDEMVGKAAPEITGEFCLNGKTTKLSELKGKVVLIDFWAVWCGPCIATFPHLRDWSKEFEKDLVILGVTTYYERIGFDKDAGKVQQLKESMSPAEEQAMVKEFAAHHKLTHQLLISGKTDHSNASKAYAVQGIPTAVLVDRDGVIRMIRVGSGEQNATALHEEIKKLVSQK